MTNTLTTITLQNVQETLLVPLWCRARFSKLTNKLFIDEKAIELIERFKYNFSVFEKNISSFMQLRMIARAWKMDSIISRFVKDHPDAIIINLGAGLDTTFNRIDNGLLLWYDIDLPDVIALRKELIGESDRNVLIASSAFDFTWKDKVKCNENNTLIVAAGLLFYFNKKTIQKFFVNLTRFYSKAEIIFDTVSFIGMLFANAQLKKNGLKSAKMQWSVGNLSSILKWDRGLSMVAEYPLFENFPIDKSWDKKTVDLINTNINRKINKIVHLKMNDMEN